MASPRLSGLAVFTALVLLSITPALRAQDANPPQKPEQRGSALLDRVREAVNSLSLTDDQKKQVDTLIDETRQKFTQMTEDFRKNQVQAQERLAKLRELMQDFRTKMEGILTDEQKQQLREKLPALTGEGGIGGRLMEALKQLNLSEDQKAKVKEVVQQARQKVQELRNEANGDAAAMREKVRSIVEDARAKIKEILTPEQWDKIKDIVTETRPAARPRQDQGR